MGTRGGAQQRVVQCGALFAAEHGQRRDTCEPLRADLPVQGKLTRKNRSSRGIGVAASAAAAMGAATYEQSDVTQVQEQAATPNGGAQRVDGPRQH
jgi:hypothetical protein